MTATQEKRGRPVTHEEARAAFQRLVNSHFHNGNGARCSIPAEPSDDDLLLGDYLLEMKARSNVALMTEWIAVEMMPPPPMTEVLIWNPSWGTVLTGGIDEDGEWCGNYGGKFQPQELPPDAPTHWQAKPAPPKEGM